MRRGRGRLAWFFFFSAKQMGWLTTPLVSKDDPRPRSGGKPHQRHVRGVDPQGRRCVRLPPPLVHRPVMSPTSVVVFFVWFLDAISCSATLLWYLIMVLKAIKNVTFNLFEWPPHPGGSLGIGRSMIKRKESFHLAEAEV